MSCVEANTVKKPLVDLRIIDVYVVNGDNKIKRVLYFLPLIASDFPQSNIYIYFN